MPGSRIDLTVEPGRVILHKQVSPDVLECWEGDLRGKVPAASAGELIEMLLLARLPSEGEPT